MSDAPASTTTAGDPATSEPGVAMDVPAVDVDAEFEGNEDDVPAPDPEPQPARITAIPHAIAARPYRLTMVPTP